MQVVLNIGEFTLISVVALFLGVWAIAFLMMFYAVIRAQFFSSDGVKDKSFQRAATFSLTLIKRLRILWLVGVSIGIGMVVLSSVWESITGG
jgi:uncharacterized membrane protein YeiB